jgi:DNA-binding response OmpR family regulator
MQVKVVLAVGVDSWMLAAHSVEWRSAGFIVMPASTMKEAFDHFRNGDFDLVLLGNSLSAESKERLTYLIRTSSSRTPVVSIDDSSANSDSNASVTVKNDGNALLNDMRELLAEKSRPHLAQIHVRGAA